MLLPKRSCTVGLVFPLTHAGSEGHAKKYEWHEQNLNLRSKWITCGCKTNPPTLLQSGTGFLFCFVFVEMLWSIIRWKRNGGVEWPEALRSGHRFEDSLPCSRCPSEKSGVNCWESTGILTFLHFSNTDSCLPQHCWFSTRKSGKDSLEVLPKFYRKCETFSFTKLWPPWTLQHAAKIGMSSCVSWFPALVYF